MIRATEQPATRPPLGAFDPTHNGADDAFVSKLNPAGTALVYRPSSAALPSNGAYGIAVDSAGAAYVDRRDRRRGACLSDHRRRLRHDPQRQPRRLRRPSSTPAGSALAYSTFIGGSAADAAVGDRRRRLRQPPTSTGQTLDGATDYPATSGSFDLTPQRRGSTPSRRRSTPPAARSPTRPSSAAPATTPGAGSRSAADGSAYLTGDTLTPVPTTRRLPASFDQTHNGLDDVFVDEAEPGGQRAVVLDLPRWRGQ